MADAEAEELVEVLRRAGLAWLEPILGNRDVAAMLVHPDTPLWRVKGWVPTLYNQLVERLVIAESEGQLVPGWSPYGRRCFRRRGWRDRDWVLVGPLTEPPCHRGYGTADELAQGVQRVLREPALDVA